MKYCFLISDCDNFLDETCSFIQKHTYYADVKIKIRKNDFKSSHNLLNYISSRTNEIHHSNLSESVILIDDFFDIEQCNPITIPCDNNHFYGMLILAYPELEFVFLNKYLNGTRTLIEWIENENSQMNQSFIPLFDHLGIRNKIRENVNKGVEPNLTTRDHKARIIEDEQSFAFFHAYIAYKRGYKSKLYTTLNHLVQDKDSTDQVQLQIQDLSLGFGDKGSKTHLSDLGVRYTDFSFLNNTIKDFAITTGQRSAKDNAKKISITINGSQYNILDKAPASGHSIILKSPNEKSDYVFVNKVPNENDPICSICGLKIASHETLVKKAKLIYKPTKGMFHIESKLGLEQWPIKEKSISFEHNSHSAEGVLALLAENLLARAQSILSDAKQVTDAIHAAVLALDAKELLNGLTPTLAFQVFALQQKSEVTAECLFAGTEYNILLKNRFDEIEYEVTSISERFSPRLQKNTILNTQLSIIEGLSGIYSNFRQFEEELSCLNLSRKLSFKLLPLKLKGKYRGLKKIYFILLSITEFVLRSVWHLLGAVLALQLFYGFIYFLFAKSSDYCTLTDSTHELCVSKIKLFFFSIVSASKYFFTLESTSTFNDIFKEHETISGIILGSQGFLSITFFSILLSFTFQNINRK